MKYRLRTILVSLPLLLFLAVCALWVRSYFSDDTYAWYSDYAAKKHWYVASNLGGLVLCYTEGHADDELQGFRSRPVSDWERNGLLGDVFNLHRRRVERGIAGFWKFHSPRRPTRNYLIQFWGLPYWFIFALAAPVPLITAIRRRRRRQRRDKNQCLSCGHDLRATPDRCPECGALNPPTP